MRNRKFSSRQFSVPQPDGALGRFHGSGGLSFPSCRAPLFLPWACARTLFHGSPAIFPSGHLLWGGLGGCSGSGGSFCSASTRSAAQRSTHQLFNWSTDTFTSPALTGTGSLGGLFGGVFRSRVIRGGSVLGRSTHRAAANKLGWVFSSLPVFSFSSAILIYFHKRLCWNFTQI